MSERIQGWDHLGDVKIELILMDVNALFVSVGMEKGILGLTETETKIDDTGVGKDSAAGSARGSAVEEAEARNEGGVEARNEGARNEGGVGAMNGNDAGVGKVDLNEARRDIEI